MNRLPQDGCVESAITIACEGDALVGVLSAPADRPSAGVAFLVIVGGPQYRVGSHRQFVQLSRALATEGFTCLRFDVRGMGDSSGEARSFESLAVDIGAAVDALVQRTGSTTRVVLWGLCDGASAALLYLQARRDARVHGLCLLNPWVRSELTQAQTQVRHYYVDRLRQPEFWRKLLRGQVAASALTGLVRSLRVALGGSPSSPAAGAEASYQDRMAEGWAAFRGPTLLVLSGQDLTAREFEQYARGQSRWQRLLAAPMVERHDIVQADHTFSDIRSKAELAHLTARWARQAFHC
jgi:uncharacterized protein